MIVNHSCAKMHLLLQCSSIKSLLERTAVAVDKYNSTNFVFFSERTLLVGSLLGKSSFPSPTYTYFLFPITFQFASCFQIPGSTSLLVTIGEVVDILGNYTNTEYLQNQQGIKAKTNMLTTREKKRESKSVSW